jgi:hypothetical protein
MPQKIDEVRSNVNIMNYWCQRPEKEVYVYTDHHSFVCKMLL